jgi:prophage antirepressor-like protein
VKLEALKHEEICRFHEKSIDFSERYLMTINSENQSNQLTPFQFLTKHPLRVQADENGNPWFVATDVAEILGYRDAFDMARNLDDNERGLKL